MKSHSIKGYQELTTNSRNPEAMHFGYTPDYVIDRIASRSKKDNGGYSRLHDEEEKYSHKLNGSGEWHRNSESQCVNPDRGGEHREFGKEVFLWGGVK